MTGTTAQTPSEADGTDLPLPRPRRGSRWRWSRPGQALVAGGTLAAALGLGVAAGTGAGAATTTSGAPAQGRSPSGPARPTVSGKIAALSGEDITLLQSDTSTTVTVVYGSSTRIETDAGPGGGTTSSASALKVGDVVGVRGTRNSDGTVTATTVTVGRPPRMGKGGPGGAAGREGTPPAGAPSA